MKLTDDEVETLDRIANTLGGMRFDRRIPTDTTNECIQGLSADLEAIVSRLIDGGEGSE